MVEESVYVKQEWLAQSRLFPRNQPFPDMLHSPPSFEVQTHY